MKSKKGVLRFAFILLFVLGILLSLGGRVLCIRDNGDYRALQPELFAPDEIEAVLHDDSLGQIYVCYNDASYVNVYDDDGVFLWAVSTPRLRNVYFELSDGQLLIYNLDDAYIYGASNGDFVAKKSSEDLDLQYNWQKESTEVFEAGAFYFDTYQVYRAVEGGELITLVSRPWWYRIFNFGLCWCVSFVSGIGFCVSVFLERRKDYRKTKEAPKGPKAKTIIRYFQVTSAVHIAYALLDIIFGIFFDGILCIGIVPLALHIIISSIVIYNILDRLALKEAEEKAVNYWRFVELGTFVIAFLSVIVAVMLA